LAPLLLIAALCIVGWRGCHLAILTPRNVAVNEAADNHTEAEPDL
jgi:hypothetical protein